MNSLILFVKVSPRALKSEVLSFQENQLHVRLKAIPEKGKGNLALCALLSEVFEIPQSQIEILSGSSSKLKKVQLTGVSIKKIEELRQRYS